MIKPTYTTAALAGIFSGATWMALWPRFSAQTANADVTMVLVTALVVIMPAQFLVVGLRSQRGEGPVAQGGMAKRVMVWLVCAGVAAFAASRYFGLTRSATAALAG